MLSEGLLYKEDVILTWMRDRFLQDLVLGRKPKSTNVKESLSRLNLNPYFTYPAIALIEPSSSNPGEREQALSEEMRDYVQQQLAGGTGSIVFMDDRNRVCLLFSWVSKADLESIQSKLTGQFGAQLTIAVGKPCNHLSDIKQSYQQAACAMQDKFYRGTGNIIYYSEHLEYVEYCDYPADKELELHEALKAADSAADIELAVEAFYRSMLEHGPVDINAMYELTARLLIGTEKKLLTAANPDNAYTKFEIMSIVKMQTLQEIKQYVCHFLSGVREAMSSEQNERHRSIIKKTIYHMEQDYQALSLQSVAQKVYMTPTYLSLLFKLNTGKTFIEHLTDIRIEKAKKLLGSTHYKNYEVAEQVGYQDPRYFSQIFKKKVGLSPTEYRESVAK
ncbi:helix-turn-helix domain-containing protein [Paenibacillus silvisoli]|uniref:helix-turn-helix domain-containing protein n=1 Tax=Paenibacillus silvisoli TaxID=3110539 RepID=UPI0028061FA8|nr:helix-turn-helix domain-containing protein [Paenibacillus silvisoli]